MQSHSSLLMEFARCMSVSMSSHDSTRKRKAVANENPDTIEPQKVEALVKTGGIADLTVAQLKEYLKHKNLPLKGKKVDLVDRIVEHVKRESA